MTRAPRLRTHRASIHVPPAAAPLLGADFVHRITNREAAPLRIGSQSWTTHELAVQLGCVHVAAARLLTRAAESLTPKAKNVRDLYLRSTPYTFAGIARLGPTTMYVLWRLFESQGLNAAEWAEGGERGALVTFATMKHREAAALERTRVEHRQRTGRSRLSDSVDYNQQRA